MIEPSADQSPAPHHDDAPAAPEAPRVEHVWHRPTGDVTDDYAWMRDSGDERFLAHLEAENEFAAAWFAPHEPLIEEIFDEIRARVQETDLSVPVFNGGWWYVTSTEEGRSYPVHHRGPTADDATAAVLLDENVEAEGYEYFDLGAFDACHDHSMIAWSTDTTGDERYTLRVRSVGADGSTHDRDDHIDGVSNAGVAWSTDGAWLFYVRPDDQERPYQVWRHMVGAGATDLDVLVYEETDERFFVEIGETRSDRWIVIHSASKTSSEVRLIRSDSPLDAPTVVAPRRDDVEYQIDDWGDRFVMVTNDDAIDFRVLQSEPVVVDANDDDGDPDDEPADATRITVWPPAGEWSELVPHEPGRRIVGVEPFATHLVVAEWAEAQPRLRILFRDGTERIVDLGDEPHDVNLSANPEWSTTVLRFGSQSLTTPPTLYEDDVISGDRTMLKRVPTPNVDLDAYTSSRTWATAPDGTAVPLDLVHHVDTPLDGTAPGCLYGYGAYEVSFPPWFSVARLSLLDRGVVWALAHPRGGGELGRQWYLDGKLLTKQRTFDDMLACAAHLGNGVVAADRLAIRGGSAGGLLVGACMTQRPDAFASVVAEVPFVDIVNTMSDTTLPLTVTEWEEWGDPRSEPFASVIAAYSPYDNSVPADYPALYVTAGLTDPRVSVHEPAKWVARLRAVGTGNRPLVMRTEMGAGHGGPTGRYDAWRDEARTLAFLLATT